MKIHIYSEKLFENWDWTNSVETGIGGSETSAVEMAWRLARRGHEVKAYSPTTWKGTKQWRGVTWTHHKHADFTEDGLWVLYRCPPVLDKFGPRRVEQPRWLMCQDAHYGITLTKERCDKLDKVLPLCPIHAQHLAQVYPGAKEKLWITTNGVKSDLVREIEAEGIVRNPKKLIWASSPDRGLVNLLKIFQHAREIVPDLELSIFYGFNNIDILLKDKAPWAVAYADIKRNVKALLKQPGVTFHGRINQKQLYREWLSAGLWVYPTDFTETSCVTCMEAQAMGAVPIFHPIWALHDNVAWGVAIDGSPTDPLVSARYVGEIVRLTSSPHGLAHQEAIRQAMMRESRVRHNWELPCDQWECEIEGRAPTSYQFNFQFKHAVGRTLNIGCDTDAAGWHQAGAVNMDVRATSPVSGATNKYDVLHDAREPFPQSIGTFDSIVIGDMLEHVTAEDWPKVLTNARHALRANGRLVITCPDDAGRPPTEQHQTSKGDETYAPGCSAFHTRRISRDEITEQLRHAGFQVAWYQALDYGHFPGHGVVATLVPVLEMPERLNGRHLTLSTELLCG